MSLSVNLSSPTGQEKRKILHEYGFLVSKETEMQEDSRKYSFLRLKESEIQEDSRKCHQDSSFLRLKETEMFLSTVPPLNTDEEAFLNNPHCSYLETLISFDVAGNLFDGNQSSFSLDYNMNSQRSTRLKLKPRPRCVKNTSVEASEQQWTIKRVLNKSDVGFGGGRLFLQKKSFEKHILKHLPEEDKEKMVFNKSGIIVKVYDHDTGTVHELRMAFLKCYVLMGHWWKQFVKRRELIVGDKIGLFWECSTSTLHFRVLSRAISKAPGEI